MDSSAIFFLLLSIVVALTSETPFVFAFCPHRLPPPSARCLHPPSPKHSAGRRESDIQLRPSARAIPLHWPATAARRVALRAASSDDSIPVEITLPTPGAAAGMGIRDWPQQFHSSTWTDTCREGGIATRYVLDGKGRLTIDYCDYYMRGETAAVATPSSGTHTRGTISRRLLFSLVFLLGSLVAWKPLAAAFSATDSGTSSAGGPVDRDVAPRNVKFKRNAREMYDEILAGTPSFVRKRTKGNIDRAMLDVCRSKFVTEEDMYEIIRRVTPKPFLKPSLKVLDRLRSK